MVHSVKKSLKDYGDKLDAGEKEKIEAAIKEAESVLKVGRQGRDRREGPGAGAGRAEARREDVRRGAGQAAGGARRSRRAPARRDAGKKDDGNVVDAEFTEVKDKKTG